MKCCELRCIKKLCVRCYARKARVRRDGRVVWDRRNVLCFECRRAAQNRLRSEVLALDHSFPHLPQLEMAPDPAKLVLSQFSSKPSSGQILVPEVHFYPSASERRTYELGRA